MIVEIMRLEKANVTTFAGALELSCKMSQIWQINLCKKYQKVGLKSLWEYKTGSFFGHTVTTTVAFFLQNSPQDKIFGNFW